MGIRKIYKWSVQLSRIMIGEHQKDIQVVGAVVKDYDRWVSESYTSGRCSCTGL